MARRRNYDPEKIDDEVIKAPTIDLNLVEIKGRGKKWHLFHADPQNISNPVAVFDQEGKMKEVVYAQVASNKMVEVHETFTSEKAAREAAEFIKPGCEIKVTHTSKNEDNLAKAREAKRKRQEQEVEDDE